MTQFTDAYHILDNYGTQVTVGIDRFNQVHIVNSGMFTPENAEKLAAQIIALASKARERETASAAMEPLFDADEMHERFPLRTQWGYNRYQALADSMSPKQAMAQASREETQTFPCGKCGKPIRLFDDGIWCGTELDALECNHEPAIPEENDE